MPQKRPKVGWPTFPRVKIEPGVTLQAQQLFPSRK